MDDLLKGLTGGQGASGQGAGGLADLLGGLTGPGGVGSMLGPGGLGSVLGAGVGAGVGNRAGGAVGGILGGGLGALIPTLLPALLGMLGSKGSGGQSGLQQVVDGLHAKGLGDVAQSWVGTGGNLPITPEQVQQVLTPAQIAELSTKSGLPPQQVSAGLAAILPHVASSLTPDGQVPSHDAVASATSQLQQELSALMGQQPG